MNPSEERVPKVHIEMSDLTRSAEQIQQPDQDAIKRSLVRRFAHPIRRRALKYHFLCLDGTVLRTKSGDRLGIRIGKLGAENIKRRMTKVQNKGLRLTNNNTIRRNAKGGQGQATRTGKWMDGTS